MKLPYNFFFDKIRTSFIYSFRYIVLTLTNKSTLTENADAIGLLKIQRMGNKVIDFRFLKMANGDEDDVCVCDIQGL